MAIYTVIGGHYVPCACAQPYLSTLHATLLCCGRKRRAECFVTTLALWVDLVTLQLGRLQTAINAFAISAAPFAIIANVMLVVPAISYLANNVSLVFTMFAHL